MKNNILNHVKHSQFVFEKQLPDSRSNGVNFIIIYAKVEVSGHLDVGNLTVLIMMVKNKISTEKE